MSGGARGQSLERVGLKTAAAHAPLSCPGPGDPGPSQGSAQEPGGKGWAPPRWNRPQEAEILPKPRARSPLRSGTTHTVQDKALYSQPRASRGTEVGMPGGGAGLLQLLLGLHGGVGWRLLERTPGPARSCALSPPSRGLALRPGTVGQRYPPTRGPPAPLGAPPWAPLQAAHPHCPGTWRSSPGPWSSCIRSPEGQESLDA